jgi:hypothetical protein
VTMADETGVLLHRPLISQHAIEKLTDAEFKGFYAVVISSIRDGFYQDDALIRAIDREHERRFPPACGCGAWTTSKAPKYDRAHPSYCPWASNYRGY